MKWSLWAVAISVLLVGCIPEHLKKYRRKQAKTKKSAPATARLDPASDVDTRAPVKKATKRKRTARRYSAITSVDQHTFRFQMSEKVVWDAMIDVLLRNYSLNIVDRDSGVITTEWDTFYLRDSIYRNKVSMRMKRLSRDVVEMTIHNGVEKLDNTNNGSPQAIWLPSRDVASEVVRLIKNVAIVLNEPAPRFPPGMIAKGLENKANQIR